MADREQFIWQVAQNRRAPQKFLKPGRRRGEDVYCQSDGLGALHPPWPDRWVQKGRGVDMRDNLYMNTQDHGLGGPALATERMKEAIAIDRAQRGNDYTMIDNTGYTPVVRRVQPRTYTMLAPEFVDPTNGETEESRVLADRVINWNIWHRKRVEQDMAFQEGAWGASEHGDIEAMERARQVDQLNERGEILLPARSSSATDEQSARMYADVQANTRVNQKLFTPSPVDPPPNIFLGNEAAQAFAQSRLDGIMREDTGPLTTVGVARPQMTLSEYERSPPDNLVATEILRDK